MYIVVFVDLQDCVNVSPIPFLSFFVAHDHENWLRHPIVLLLLSVDVVFLSINILLSGETKSGEKKSTTLFHLNSQTGWCSAPMVGKEIKKKKSLSAPVELSPKKAATKKGSWSKVAQVHPPGSPPAGLLPCQVAHYQEEKLTAAELFFKGISLTSG